MTLDEGYVSNAEMARRGREQDMADAKARYEEQRLVESVESRESYWSGVMAAMPEHVRQIRYAGDS